MGTTLTNGVYLPNEGERNCYAGLKTNWEILDQKVADVTALQQAVAGALHREIVESLPTTDIDPNTIYMVLSGTSATENVYNEFMYVNNAWELIGTSATDLTNYYTKSEVDGKLLLKANASDLTSHTGDTTIHVTTADKSTWNTVTSKANDSDVVHKSGDETIGGQKTFSHGQTGVGRDIYHLSPIPYGKNTPPANISYQYIWFTGNSASQGLTNNWYSGYLEQLVSPDGSARGRWLVRRTDETVASVEILASADNTLTFRPSNGNVMQLGDSSRPWKDCKTSAINGLNPSSLGMPDLSNGIDISGYINTGDSVNSYTPLVDGYISVRVNSTNSCGLYASQGDVYISSYGNIVDVDLGGFICSFFIPVVKNVACRIVCRRAQTIVSAKFYPCLGNV